MNNYTTFIYKLKFMGTKSVNISKDKVGYRKDLTEMFEFDRCGYHYVNICYDKDNHKGIWEMRKGDRSYGFEVVRGKKYKNPDGNIVYIYPSDEQFGTYGWYLCGRNALNRSLDKLKSL